MNFRMDAFPFKYLLNLVKKCIFLAEYFLYEVTYYVLGGQAIVEDLLYKRSNKCDIINKSGQVAVVTGGARGIGAKLVKKLLQCNMTVVIACRSLEAGRNKLKEIRDKGVSEGKAHVYPLDLRSLKSVEAFVEEVSQEFPKVHLLVNNAGIMFPPYEETKEGFESQWAVNYLAPFYLTHLMMPLLEKASIVSEARIVNVSSIASVAARPINFKNINMKNRFIPSAAYAQSKLAQILFTLRLAEELNAKKSNVKVHVVHPGVANTDLFDGTFLKRMAPWVVKYLFKSPDAAATSVLFPCISPLITAKNGTFSSNCVLGRPSRLAQDKIMQGELFNYSLKTLQIAEFGKRS